MKAKLPVHTWGAIVPKSQFHSYLIPSQVPRLYEDAEEMLMVYYVSSDLSRITCYPLKKLLKSSAHVIKITVTFDSLTPAIIKDLNNIIPRSLIHTTGLAINPHEDPEKPSVNSMEMYFQITDVEANDASIEKLAQNLKSKHTFLNSVFVEMIDAVF